MRKQDNDIVVTFDARDSGIDSTEFAPKLLGRNRKGEIIFGYASLPYVDYRPAILSSLRPTYDAEGGCITTDMENFGLSASKESTLTITTTNGRHFTASIPPIEPYGKATVRIDTDTAVDLQGCEVTVTTAGKVVHSQQW